MTDVYDKDVIHIFLHTNAHTLLTLKLSQTCTGTPTAEKVNDIPKEIIHCYGFPNQLTCPFPACWPVGIYNRMLIIMQHCKGRWADLGN